ncbi:DMT family transporter, partial [Burkholderia gladioli]
MNRYAFILILSMLLVGSNVGIGKTIVVVVPVAILATLRFVIANAVLWPLWRPSKMRNVKRDEWLNLFLQALFGTFLFTLLMLTGVQRTSAVAAGVITSTIPAVVALFAWIFLRERPDGRALLSIALAIVGVVAINLANGHAPGAASAVGSSLAGNLLILGAVCCESFYVILSRRLTETLRPLDICAYTHLFGMLLMLPLGLL